ncbi:hypothetical protein BDR07DRAFT_1424588 [Suillus spraguei]|nr:hypothetical protein BDR07DRAFT_1424588 [Suillus spraguei]
MRSFSTLALILPVVLAAPLKPATHHQHLPSCVIAGVAYPDPRHTLILLGRREVNPPTGLSERAFTDFLILCHESGGRSSSRSLIARQQGSYLSNALGDPAGSDSMLSATIPGGAPPTSDDQHDSSSAAGPSMTPVTTTSPTPSPSKTFGSAAGPTSTGTPAGNETPANPVGSPPFENTAAIAPVDNDASHHTKISEIPLAQSDSSAFDVPFTTTPQGATANFSDSFVDSDVSDNFGDMYGSTSHAFNSPEDAPVDDGREPATVHAEGGV